MDPLTISLIIAIFSGFALIIARLHLKRCHSVCCDSDCTKTPNNSSSELNVVPLKEPSIIYSDV